MKVNSNKKVKNMAIVASLLLMSLYVFYSVVTLMPTSGVKKWGLCMHSLDSIKKSNDIRTFIIKAAKSMDLEAFDLSDNGAYSNSGDGFILIHLTEKGFLSLNEIEISFNSTRSGSSINVYGSINDDLYKKNIKFINKPMKILQMLKENFAFVTYPENSWGSCEASPSIK